MSSIGKRTKTQGRSACNLGLEGEASEGRYGDQVWGPGRKCRGTEGSGMLRGLEQTQKVRPDGTKVDPSGVEGLMGIKTEDVKSGEGQK